jgi:hypothetical protein
MVRLWNIYALYLPCSEKKTGAEQDSGLSVAELSTTCSNISSSLLLSSLLCFYCHLLEALYLVLSYPPLHFEHT